MIIDNDNINLSKNSFKYNVRTTYSSRDTYVGLFKLIFIILISIVLIRFLYSSDSTGLNTMSLLEMLQDMPSVSSAFKNFSSKLLIEADWGAFDFLRNFINTLSNLWSILMWISGALIDVILFLGAFLRYLFI